MRRKSAEKEARILAAATELFLHYGPAKTTMTDIAKRAGVAVGTVYVYFASKDEILIAFADHFAAEHAAQAEAIREGDLPPAQKLMRYVEARLAAWVPFAAPTEGARDIARAVVRLRPERVADFRRTFEETVAEILREGVRAGVFTVPDPVAAAEAFVCAVSVFFPLPGAITQHAVEPDALGRVVAWFVSVWAGADVVAAGAAARQR